MDSVKVKFVNVTPEKAREWLLANSINRSLRVGEVERWKGIFARGEYIVSPEGLVFADTGELLDGQHRLTAVSEMPEGFVARFSVQTGWDKSVFMVLNKGVGRTHADTLGISTGHAAVARYVATINETEKNGITTQSLIQYVRLVERPYAELMAYCSKNSKVWSASPFRAAAVLQMLNGCDADYIKLVYHAMNHADFDDMPPIARTLFKQHLSGMATNKNSDMFCRAWKAFDMRNQAMTKLQISDRTTIIGQARDLIAAHLSGKKKPPVTAAKKVNARNSTAKAIA